ncbi:NEL-type E3 ubiquitin ligase domain-containing protein [Pseudomonas sp. RW3S2]|uniref:NEL-type E3 ubiquitin ligase domain-containing protein n=1 Tax=Pseudomonas sp. RW3S2 TaxID=485884 RepID=UPI00164743FA|nr:NEL-type E3 ubiquitin ligase domain-containing protein [Pseudomonas sp. RW3S2]MBC3421382.1 hypothetical protein [Pseudomonas sp. RW3S2]
MPTRSLPDETIDTLIASRLPNWLSAATPEQLDALHRALRAQQHTQHAVRALLGQIQPLEEFAAPLLSEALDKQVQPSLDVRRSMLRREVQIRFPSSVGWAPDGIVMRSFEHSLLASALHNFERAETSKVAWRAASAVLDAEGNTLALQPRVFAGLCRTLDLGGLYQQHLKHVLFGNDAIRRHNEALLEQGWREGLEATAWLARLKGDIDEHMLAALQKVCASPSQPASLTALDIRLLGRRIQGVVVFQMPGQEGAEGQPEQLIAWIPDDPQGALSVHSSWSELFKALGRRFRQAGYWSFFQRFVSVKDRVHFAQVLERLLAQGGPQVAIELDGRWQPVAGPLFAHLRQVQVDTLLDDAKVLAVPTSLVDSVERDRRLHWLKGLGLDVLGIASFFVPELGLPLLAITAEQLTEEVYEGYRDWELGDREAALGHLVAVAQNLALLGVTAGASKVLERVAQVDELAPLRGADGQLRLARADLPGYATQEVALAHGERATLDGQTYQGIEGTTYRLGDDPDVAAAAHPNRPEASTIALEDNGAGGLRHALEPAQQWQGEGMLIRRLGRGLRQVSDDMAGPLLRSIGMDEAQIRRLHLENAPAPARLYDAAQRYQLHDSFPKLRGAAFEAHVQELQATPVPAAQPLHRDFPSLTTRAGQELLDQANADQLQQLLEHGRVPLALAERARWQLRDARLDRACAGFEQAAAVVQDTEQLALGLLQAWSPWDSSVRIEVRDGQFDGQVLAQVGDSLASQTRRMIKTAKGYLAVDAQGTPMPSAYATDDLFQALLWHLDAPQRLQLGEAARSARHLADALAARAFAQREQAARLIGMAPIGTGLRPAQRLGDGRIGYLLSGRPEGSRRALLRGYQQVFPTLSDVEVEAYLETVRQRGEGLWDHLRNLQQQMISLNQSLGTWRREIIRAPMIERRRLIAQRIRHCWRRKRVEHDGTYRLIIDSERLDSLPTLPEGVTFEHVTQLTLRRLNLQAIDADFLSRFANLRSLDLRDNLIDSIPEGLQLLTQLTELHLAGNQIVIDEAGMARLSVLTQLRTLDLAHNPIGRLPPLGPLENLQRLSLRGTGLVELPVEVYMHPQLEDIDLRDNNISDMSPTLARSRRRLAGLSLHDNALPETAQATLRTAMGEDAAVIVPLRRHAPGGQESLELWLAGSTDAQRTVREGQWNGLLHEPGSSDLMRFLHDLGRSRDYAMQGLDLRRRVWQVIDACVQNSEVREAIFQQAAGPRTCSDQMLLILSLLEVRALVATRTIGLAPAAVGPALTQLGRELYRLDEVDSIAARHIQQARIANPYGLHDEVEVHLAYRAGLVKPLGLPAQSRYMYHRMFSDVGEAELRRASTAILQAETNARIAASLVQRSFWQDYLRNTQAEAFETLNQPYHERLEALMAEVESSPEQGVLDDIQTLAEERSTAERELVLGFTLSMLDAHPWVGG